MADVDETRTKDTAAKAYRRTLSCAVSGCNGEMQSAGHGFTTWHTAWQHRCSKCGVIEDVNDHQFPEIVYR